MKWIEWYYQNGMNARLTCRHFGISPDTFYCWLRRYQPKDSSALEDKSRKPRRLRQPSVLSAKYRYLPIMPFLDFSSEDANSIVVRPANEALETLH
ncbi:MAG: helix-turn-helix domain-containing protein [Dehalococcoidia bacterium]|nr:helix-turn-helix domain-containing protein [Dehalococcoidia bacterium]